MLLKMKRILVIILTFAIISGNVAFAAGSKGSGSFSGVSNDNATVGEQNALRVGRDYLNAMGFSYQGLIEQLEYEGFSHEEAVYACDILFEKSDLPVKKGSKGDKVKEIQNKLVELGFLSGGVDGIFGGGTEKAVKAFQTDRGLDVTGIVDEITYEALYEVIDLEEKKDISFDNIEVSNYEMNGIAFSIPSEWIPAKDVTGEKMVVFRVKPEASDHLLIWSETIPSLMKIDAGNGAVTDKESTVNYCSDTTSRDAKLIKSEWATINGVEYCEEWFEETNGQTRRSAGQFSM